MNQALTFDDLAKTIESSHYFDSESWYKDILKTPYDVIFKDGFGIIFEYRKIFGYKVGHSRGGVLFEKKAKTLKEYNNFLSFLKVELKNLGYAFTGIDFVDEANEYNSMFPSSNIRDYINGTAYIYPKKDWANKFNSKKRSDLLSAKRKGIQVSLFTNTDTQLENKVDINKFYTLVSETLQRHANVYTLPSKEAFERMFKYSKFILGIAHNDNDWLSYNLSIFNTSGTRVERVFAGSNELGLKLRCPSFIEVELVEYLAQKNIQIYDLWGVKNPEDGVSAFKKSIADEYKFFRPYGLIKIRKFQSFFIIIALKLSKFIQNFKKHV